MAGILNRLPLWTTPKQKAKQLPQLGLPNGPEDKQEIPRAPTLAMAAPTRPKVGAVTRFSSTLSNALLKDRPLNPNGNPAFTSSLLRRSGFQGILSDKDAGTHNLLYLQGSIELK